MTTPGCSRCDGPAGGDAAAATRDGVVRVALVGNPNTGKTTLFNRLCGLRHKTSNFPGTTQESRTGTVKLENGGGGRELRLVDLPGVYSLKLAQNEAEICRDVLEGSLAAGDGRPAAPDAVCVVVDAANLPRNLTLVGEVLAQRLPTVVALNMIDLANRAGIRINTEALREAIGCGVVECSARKGDGLDRLVEEIGRARVPNRTAPGDRAALEQWADSVASRCSRYGSRSGKDADSPRQRPRGAELTDRLDHVFTHPVLGPAICVGVMTALFFVLFKIARVPMDLIDHVFKQFTDLIQTTLPPGILNDFLAQGVVSGVGATVIFVPQICLLFFLISLLEDTGYLARAAFLMDRLLRPFGLPGHAFVPLLSSHACALPGIMATRAIPDRRERLATILVAPFMTCSARIPVYVLVTSILFKDRPALAAIAFVGAYALGTLAGLVSALIARRTILRGKSRPMAMELPTYKLPSVRTALLTTYDRAMIFLKNAGTNILAICVVLWWLGAFPHVDPPARAVELRQQAIAATSPITAPGTRDGPVLSQGELRNLIAQTRAAYEAGASDPKANRDVVQTHRLALDIYETAALPEEQRIARVAAWAEEADSLERSHAKAQSYAGRLGRLVQPVFAPLGFDWKLTVGVITSFAAREVFVSTMAIVVAGAEDRDAPGVLEAIRQTRRPDGLTPVFDAATSWSVLVFFVLAMQCLPTLAVTAREAGGVKWALLQLAWMSGLAYVAAYGVHHLVLALAH